MALRKWLNLRSTVPGAMSDNLADVKGEARPGSDQFQTRVECTCSLFPTPQKHKGSLYSSCWNSWTQLSCPSLSLQHSFLKASSPSEIWSSYLHPSNGIWFKYITLHTKHSTEVKINTCAWAWEMQLCVHESLQFQRQCFEISRVFNTFLLEWLKTTAFIFPTIIRVKKIQILGKKSWKMMVESHSYKCPNKPGKQALKTKVHTQQLFPFV